MNELQIHTLLEQASRFHENGKTLHAIQLIEQVMNDSPSCDRAYVMLAQMYSESKRHDFAEKVLLRGLEANNQNQEYYFLLGNMHLGLMQLEKALTYFRKISNLAIPQVHLNLGLIHMGLGNLDESESELKAAAQLDSRLPKVHELWGELLVGRGRWSEAVDVLERAVRVDQQSGSSHRLLGKAYARLSQWQLAYDNLVVAVDLDPHDAEAWSQCGDVLLHLNSYTEAKKYLHRSLQLKPDNPEAKANYGKACAMLGEQGNSAS